MKASRVLRDSDCRRLFLVSFISLFLELMLIRWAPSVVELIAYYANLLLISSFLGLGTGAMLGPRRRDVFDLLPVLLLADIAVLLLCRQATLPGSAVELRFGAAGGTHVLNYAALIAVFTANAAVFVPLGQRIGTLLQRLEALTGYGWDLAGSLCGAVCFGAFSYFHFSPLAGICVVGAAFVTLAGRENRARSVLLLAASACLVAWSRAPGAVWSPYHFVTLHEGNPKRLALHEDNALGELFFSDSAPVREPRPDRLTAVNPPIYTARVNHFFYQPHMTLNPARYTDPTLSHFVEWLSHPYRLPYALTPGRERVLVLGAGGGTDVEAALAYGAKSVDAVEIDPVLVDLSRRFSPSGVYDDPRVSVRIDDARAFMRRARPGYDIVLFGWLDSQALFSQMSSVRLDGFVYTVESMRAAYGLLSPDGMLAMTFMAGQDWLASKLVRMLKEATGAEPVIYEDIGQIVLAVHRKPPTALPEKSGRMTRIRPEAAARGIETPTDDWPYLYLHRRTIPPDYLAVIGTLMGLSLCSILILRGRGFKKDDAQFLFLGTGFLLLETASIGDCSLYMGATWLVTTLVVCGVLIMCLAANALAARARPPAGGLYAALFATLAVLYAVPRAWIVAAPLAGKLAWTMLALPLPLFFAGLLFSSAFRDAKNRSALFGANLMGAMIGGFSEYLGMVVGHRSLLLLVMVAYAASLACRFGKRA